MHLVRIASIREIQKIKIEINSSILRCIMSVIEFCTVVPSVLTVIHRKTIHNFLGTVKFITVFTGVAIGTCLNIYYWFSNI